MLYVHQLLGDVVPRHPTGALPLDLTGELLFPGPHTLDPSASKTRLRSCVPMATCLRSSVMVTQLNCRPLAMVGLCHQRLLPSIAKLTGCRSVVLASSQTPHWMRSPGRRLTCSTSLQNGSAPCSPHVAFVVISAFVARLNTCGNRPSNNMFTYISKPRPHQQQCRSNIVKRYKSNDSFDKVETNWTCSICFDFFERTKFRSTLLPQTASCWCVRSINTDVQETDAYL